MITEEIVHIKGLPKKLIVFLHGYVNCASSVDNKISYLLEHLDDYALHIPQASQICEIHEGKRQWYSMHRFDPDDRRRLVPTIDECAAIYDRMTLGLQQAYDEVVPYIEQTLCEYDLTYDDVYLCGFSQGAMVALYTGLMLPQKLRGVISFSGILAGQRMVCENAQSTPDTLLIHGNDDGYVRFDAQNYSAQHIKKLGCKVKKKIIDGGSHTISEPALKAAVSFIKQQEKLRKTA